jgi:hypothetical protein
MQTLYSDLATARLELNLPKPEWAAELSRQTITPAVWFAKLFPTQTNQFGCPLLEMRQSSCDGFSRVTPISLNIDFFAAMLGGDPDLHHSVVYFEPEMQFYYFEPVQTIYLPTTPEKLQNYYRAMILRCAQELGGEADKLNLFVEFRSDKNAKAVVNRAKSVLAVGPDFFSATSPHHRVKGSELFERVARVMVDQMLEQRPDSILTVTQAYNVFCKLSHQRNLGQLKRSMFKHMMSDLVKDAYGVCLRNDVPDSENHQQQGWRGLNVVEAEALTAG